MQTLARELRLCSVATAMLIPAALDSYPVMVALVILCLIALLYELFRLFAVGFNGRYFLLSSLSCGLWISIGFLVSFIQIDHSKSFVFQSLFTASSVVIDPMSYSLATSYLMYFVASSSFVSRLAAIRKVEQRFQGIIFKRLIVSSRLQSSIILLVLCLFGLVVAGSNLLSIRGLHEDYLSEQGILPWWYPLVMTTLSLFPVVIASCISKDFRVASFRSFVVTLATLIAIYFSALQGRFALVSLLMVLPFSWLLLYKPLFKLNSKSFALVLFTFFILWMLMPFVSTIFSFINYARFYRGGSIDPSQYFALFIDFLTDSGTAADASARANENLMSRPLVLWPLAATISMAINGLNNDYIWFQDILNSLLNSLPRAIYPFKADLLLQEGLLYSYFPFSDVDTADSPYLYSFASFGLFGIIVYPIFIGFLYSAFLRIALSSIKFMSGVTAFVACALAIATVANFAIISYAELSTSGLIRQFLFPAVTLLAMAIFSFPFRQPARA